MKDTKKIATRDTATLDYRNNNPLVYIDQMLDGNIRNFMHHDGGDIELLRLEDHKLYFRFTGSCAECKYASTSAFAAIQEVVRRYDPKIELVDLTGERN